MREHVLHARLRALSARRRRENERRHEQELVQLLHLEQARLHVR